jgi:hypothetical protein
LFLTRRPRELQPIATHKGTTIRTNNKCLGEGLFLTVNSILSMRKIDWRHPACLWRHWEVSKYHRSIDKWKGYKLRKRYEAMKKVRNKLRKAWRHPACLWRHWEVWKYHRSIDKWKGYKLRKRYEVTKKVRGYEKGTNLRKR